MTSHSHARQSRNAGRAAIGAVVALVTALTLLAPGSALAQEALCTRDVAWGENRPQWAADVLALTNAHRATLGLSQLSVSATLTTAAEWKAAHMANFDYFGHDDPARSWDQRIEDCGYPYGAGENIAYGYRSPLDVFQGWLDSPGHRTNIENPNYRVIGVGAVVDDAGRLYWVQNFGTRPDPVVTPPTATTPTTAPTPTATATPSSSSSFTAPVAAADATIVEEDATVRLNPVANDRVGAGGVLEIVYVEDPSHGSIIEGDGNELIYQPDPNFTGTDSFYYWVGDQMDRTCRGQITVTVEPRNDAPIARADAAAVRPRGTVLLKVLDNDLDVDGDPISLAGLDRRPSFGAVNVDTVSGLVTYRPRRGTTGRTETITYSVTDGGASAVGTIRIRIRR